MKKRNIGFRAAAAALAAVLLFAGCSAKSVSTSSCSSSAASLPNSAEAKSNTYTYDIAGDPGNAVNVISTNDRYGLTEIKLLYSA